MWTFVLAASLSMLTQAELLSKKFGPEIAKAPPPLVAPQPKWCLETASVWFSLDLNTLQNPVETLSQEPLWDMLRTIGVEGVYMKELKTGGPYRTSIGLDPKWKESFDAIAALFQKKGIALIGNSIGNSTGIGTDFIFALKNKKDYAGLYHLVEIDKRDWKLLPQPSPSQLVANIPWLSVQELQKKGYVPEQFTPYVKQSAWNATGPVLGEDGETRRWIYLQENGIDPTLDWLHPSFGACRIASGDMLDSIYNLGEKIICLDASIQSNAQETLALWARKLGAFSVLETKGGLAQASMSKTDLISDIWTRPALLHALLTQDTEALKLIYRLYLDEHLETKRLVHTLQPFDQFTCEWTEMATHPRRKFQYYEEVLTGDALASRLLKQDIDKIEDPTSHTWPSICMKSFGQKVDITKAHLLLSLFYAMQPGAFSFSASDLLGTVQRAPIDLLDSNEHALYPSLPGQMQNPHSFAMQLRNILSIRKTNNLESGELLAVPPAPPSLLILVHRLRNQSIQLSAFNFSSEPITHVVELPVRNTTAIDLMTNLTLPKPLNSSSIRLEVAPLAGQIILFQPKYYP